MGQRPRAFCLLQGMKASQKKPVNYNKLAAIDQGPQENPTSFIENPREVWSNTPIWILMIHLEQLS